MKYLLILLLLTISQSIPAQELMGTVDHNIYRQESLPLNSTIVVRPSDDATETPNIDFYGRQFVETLRSKFPNAYWEADLQSEIKANAIILLDVIIKTDSGEYSRKIYSNEPKSIKCRESPLGFDCDIANGSKTVAGTVEETYVFYNFALQLLWFLPSGDNAAFTTSATLLADTARGNTHCSKMEAFSILSNQIVDRIDVDRPLEARYSFRSARSAGCGTK